MIKLMKAIKTGHLRKVLYLVLFCFSFLALVPRLNGTVVSGGQASVAQRQQDLAKVQSVLERKEIASRMESLGVSPAEVERRLALLSDQDVHSLALQVDKMNPGGDPFVIAGIILGLGIALVIFIYVWLSPDQVQLRADMAKAQKDKEDKERKESRGQDLSKELNP